jgi:D-hydroxyproline dehydrogenase subunit alpha
MVNSSVAVVGAGRCGLLASISLAERVRRVVLVERLPAPGGQEPERPETDALAARAREAGVEMTLGTVGVRWSGEGLEILGVAGADTVAADRLVVATGSRPATRAELGIAGDRAAGVLPGSAALHIVESGVLLGRRPLIVGGGSLAGSLVAVLREAGAEEVTVVAPEGLLDPRAGEADRLFAHWDATAAHGNPRVQSVQIVHRSRPDSGMRVFCDALILAHGRLPMRNVEGAVEGGRNVLHCHSSADPKTAPDSKACAAATVEQLMTELTSETEEE